MIKEFRGDNRFLSNFYPAIVSYEGKKYPTSEHAFQAAKTLDKLAIEKIRMAKTPGKAKRLGRKVVLRDDWDTVRILIMERIVRSKFSNDTALKEKLLATGDQELIEGNHWGDTFWGVCEGIGENNLGKLLMRVRKYLREGL